MCKNDVFVAKICNCKIRCFLSRKFENARFALALRDIWRSPLARQLIAAWYRPTAITSNMVLKQATLYGGIVTTQLYPIETARVKSLLFPLMLTVVASQDFNSFSQPDQIFPTFLDAFPSLDLCTIF